MCEWGVSEVRERATLLLIHTFGGSGRVGSWGRVLVVGGGDGSAGGYQGIVRGRPADFHLKFRKSMRSMVRTCNGHLARRRGLRIRRCGASA